MSVNRVWLIGAVAAPPRPAHDDFGDGTVLLIATLHRRASHTHVERHRIRLVGGTLDEGVTTGATVLVEGSLTRDPQRRRSIVLAHRISLLEPALPEPVATEPAGTHRSPVPHTRAEHWRRVAVGTPRERLVHVRETRVGEQAE